MSSRRVLVVGPPRSGTSWVGQVLGRAMPGAALVHEPDNHRRSLAAVAAKAGLGSQPVLTPDDSAERHDRLMAAAFTGVDPARRDTRVLRRARRALMASDVVMRVLNGDGDPSARMARLALDTIPMPQPARQVPNGVVVKSVHAAFCLERMAGFADPPVVVLLRDPRNAVASWLDMGFGPTRHEQRPAVNQQVLPALGVDPPPGGSRTAEIAWAYCLLSASLLQSAARLGPCAVVVTHEQLCADPMRVFRALFARLSLPWTDVAREGIAATNKAGDGYETNRVAAEQIERWKTRLTPEQVDDVERVVDRFPSALRLVA